MPGVQPARQPASLPTLGEKRNIATREHHRRVQAGILKEVDWVFFFYFLKEYFPVCKNLLILLTVKVTFKKCKLMFLVVLGLHSCMVVSLEWGLLYSCSLRASHCNGFSCCRTQAVCCVGFCSCRSWSLEHRLSSCDAWA